MRRSFFKFAAKIVADKFFCEETFKKLSRFGNWKVVWFVWSKIQNFRVFYFILEEHLINIIRRSQWTSLLTQKKP
jgi:hypothetical protein